MRKNLKYFWEKLLNIFFGEICFGCEKAGEIICENCLIKMKNKSKYEKIIENENINWVEYSLSYKNEKVKKALFLLKYNYTKSVAKYLAKITFFDFLNFIKKILKEKNLLYKDIIIIPIPISKKRLIERSYNQSEILIKEIILKIKEINDLDLTENLLINFLIKTKHTIKFANTHSYLEREKLIKNVFMINKNLEIPNLKEKIVFLIDDITTTGVTFYEARNELIKNGFQKENIFGFALAH